MVYDTETGLKNNLQYNDIIKLKKHICHFHIKDKNWNGENLVLGKGCVNFEKIFKAIKKIKYKGKYTFETNRGNDPIITMKNNKEFIKIIKKLTIVKFWYLVNVQKLNETKSLSNYWGWWFFRKKVL